MATKDERELYGAGLCRVHAVAAVLRHGGRFLVVTDPEEVFWHHPEDADLDRPAIVHVFSLHESADGPVARDVFGDRPAGEAAEEARLRYGCFIVEAEELEAIEDLLCHVDLDGSAEQPLAAFGEDDVREASDLESVSRPIESCPSPEPA